jgi:hypothetical protein
MAKVRIIKQGSNSFGRIAEVVRENKNHSVTVTPGSTGDYATYQAGEYERLPEVNG